ncbi:unnamed protein product [Soboliphyme baturini]|uniref:ANK_REP_REGION domain-containing protein n=1 Tax=Soboliphyme baturini TaxID=241478 RepID=A0A183J8K8_9BILA|nr:unnamed protein product [Soboliphyme baturini]
MYPFTWLALGDSHPLLNFCSAITPTVNELFFGIRDDEGNGAIHFCCKGGHVSTLNLLLQQDGVKVHEPNIYGDTPLHMYDSCCCCRPLKVIFCNVAP